MARGPDIIQNQSIPLSATSDAPVLDVPAPPISASNDPTDLQTGVPKEITAAELAVAAAARKGDPATADLTEDGKPKVPAQVDEEAEPKPRSAKKVEADDPIIADLPKESPDWYRREVASIRRIEREKTAAAFAAAKAQVGDKAWDEAVAATRDKMVGEAKAEAAKAIKEAREAREATTAREAEIAELRAKVSVPEDKAAEDPRPTRDKFDDPDEYDTALTEWGIREGERSTTARIAADKRTADAEAAAAAAEEKKTTDEAAARQAHAAWETKVAQATEKYPDYAELTTKEPEEGGPTITPVMAMAIQGADNGTDVAYFLATDTEESVRIAAIPNPVMQLFEMGRLAERLATPARRAPRAQPLEPIDTGTNTADTSEREPTMEEYAARRMPQLQQAKRPFFPASNMH